MRYDSEEYIHVEKPLSAVRRIYTMSRYLYNTMWQYADIIRSRQGAWVILRRLWVTTEGVLWVTPCGHRAHSRGVRSEFLGLIIIIALNGYNGYFSRYFNRWHARINYGRIIHRPDITMMQCYSISLPRRQRISRRPREMRRTFSPVIWSSSRWCSCVSRY